MQGATSVARSVTLSQLDEATPDSMHEYCSHLLNNFNLAAIKPKTDYCQVTEALENFDLTQTTTQLRADHLLRQMIHLTKDDHKVAMEGFLSLDDNFSDKERAVLSVLKSDARSPGTSLLCLPAIYDVYFPFSFLIVALPSCSNTLGMLALNERHIRDLVLVNVG